MKTGFPALVALGGGSVGLSTATAAGLTLGLVLTAAGTALAVATVSRSLIRYADGG
ncbi:hypothetical protein [Halobaculum litoreum]|uniref:Uncharacterized protein n=1 Tax=Halobaculum litoreum TaxID=3031998 RepID=A0ABD5XQX4_9EURY|nr:hypothetical protein [Halobaculum sp. DT92]